VIKALETFQMNTSLLSRSGTETAIEARCDILRLSATLCSAGTLASAALFASFLPARRAARVDPIRALRQE
jgi:ABC-type lipoprotein release transport system permease subunit